MDHWQGMGQNAQIKAGFDRLPVGSYILSVTRAFLDSPFSTGDSFIAEQAVVHSRPNDRYPPQLGNGQPSIHLPPSNGAAVCSFFQPFMHNRAMAQNAIFAYVCAILGFDAQHKEQIDREVRPHIETLMRGVTGPNNPLMGCIVQCDSFPADWVDKKTQERIFGTNQKYLPAPFEQLGAKRPTVQELLAKIGQPQQQGYAPQGQQGWGGTPQAGPPAGAAPPWAGPGHAGPQPGQGQDWVSPPAAPPWAPQGPANPPPGQWSPPGAVAPPAPPWAPPAGPPAAPPWAPPAGPPTYPPGTEFYPGPGPQGAQGFRVPGGQWAQVKP